MDKKAMTMAAVTAFAPGGFIVAPAVAAIVTAMATSQDEMKAAETQGLASLEQETKKQHLKMEYQSHQARVAQEIAIANRIALSHEVEIEEFYDKSGGLDGEIGGNVKSQSIKLAASKSQQDVVRRVYKFKGSPGVAA